MRLLGFDPGLRITGYGCCEGTAGAPQLVEAGVIRLVRTSRAPEDPARTPSVADRLVELERDAAEIIERLRPDAVFVESVFSHYDHPKTAVVMAHARGVLLLCARRAGIEVGEIPPASVKRSMTGSGKAEKAQVQASVRTVLGLAEDPKPADVADALAIAIAGLARTGRVSAIESGLTARE